MVITTKPVNTTLQSDYYKRAKTHGIGWTDALRIGIDVLNNDSYYEETKTIKTIKELKGKLRIYEKRLMELRLQREAKEKLEKDLTKQEITFLKSIENRISRGADKQAVFRLFNNDFNKALSIVDFEHLIKKYKK